MATAEQPLKKRKIYEQFKQTSPSTPPPTPPPQLPQAARPPPERLTQEDILRRQRNVEDIGRVYNCLKQIKACLAEEKEHDPRCMSELEQAYLYLITASRGCTSVQRIIADLIPRYATYCPTALEAAAKVVINIHNCNVTVLSGGDDFDGVSFDTTVACIFGLFDICQAAAKEAPTSSVIQAICSAVFLNVFTFLISSFEGKDIFQIIDKKIVELLDAEDFSTDFKKKFLDKGDSALFELMKCRVASFLRIFYTMPKHSIEVCFELLDSTTAESSQQNGNYFLRQLTTMFVDYAYRESPGDEDKSTSKYEGTTNEGEGIVHDRPNSNYISQGASPAALNCILGQVLNKDISLRHWILSRYRRLCKSASPQVVSHVTSVLDDTLRFLKETGVADTPSDGGSDESGQSKYTSHSVRGESSLETSFKLTGKDGFSKVCDKSSRESMTDVLDLHSRESSSFHSSTNSTMDSRKSRSLVCDVRGPGDTSHNESVPRELSSQQSHSTIPRRPGGHREAYHGRSVEKESLNKQTHSPSPRASAESRNSFQTVHRDNNQVPAISMLIERASAGSVTGSASPHFGNNLNESTQSQWLGSPSDSYTARMSQLSSMVLRLRAKYNLTTNSASSENRRTKNYQVTLTREEERYSTSILRVSIPNGNPMVLTDDELLSVCKLAISNAGSIVRLTRISVPVGSSWVIECSNTNTAMTLLKNLRVCPGIFFQIEFSHSVEQQNSHFPVNPESKSVELASPRATSAGAQVGHSFQSNQAYVGHKGVPELGSRHVDSRIMDHSRGGGHAMPSSGEQIWMHMKPVHDLRPVPGGGVPCISTAVPGPPIAPLPAVQSLPYRPPSFPPNSHWNARSFNSYPPVNPIPSNMMPNVHHNTRPPPFVPASVTPLAQFHGTTRPMFNQMYPVPPAAPPSLIPPLHQTQPEAQLPPPPSQPPLPPPPFPQPPPPPFYQPPFVPPPPSSPPPPPPPSESSTYELPKEFVKHPWQGVLSKSGVHYCTVFAQRVDSDAAKYLDNITEPTEWPSKLDMTKRTDFRHVRTSFSNTFPHKREICWLLPSSDGDHKGLQDFISYLQQRECAGVIKIPAVKSMWSRLLFILPCSPETCSMLSIAPNPSPCLVGLVLPKETNCEYI